jgi:O-antigen ligase
VDSPEIALSPALALPVPARGRWGAASAAAYLAGASLIAAVGAAVSSGPAADALVLGAWLAALPWLLTATTESLLILTVLALPFDTWKIFSAVSATNVLITIATGRLLLELMRGTRTLRPCFAYRPVAAIALVVALSTVFAVDVPAAARLTVSVFGAGAFAILIVNCATTPEMRQRLLDALFLASFLMGAAGIVQYVAYQIGIPLWVVYADYWIYNLGIAQIKVAGLMSAPGALAAYVLPAIACGLTLWSVPLPAAQRLLLRSTTLLCLAAAVLTFTRATLLTIAVLFVGLAVTRLSVRVRSPRLALAVAAILLTAFGALAAPRLIGFLNAMNPVSTYSRLSIYTGAINSFGNHPLLGAGLGAQVAQDFSNPELYALAAEVGNKDIETGLDARDTHSTPLEIAVDMGLAGLIAYCWLFVATLRRTLHTLRLADAREQPLRAAALAASLGTLLVLFFNDGIAMKSLWMMAGLLWALAPPPGVADAPYPAGEQR